MSTSKRMVVEVFVDGRWTFVEPPQLTYSDQKMWASCGSSEVHNVLCNGKAHSSRGQGLGDDVEIILPLRSWPQDVSPELKAIIYQLDSCGDDFSAEYWHETWYLLSELVAFDWTKPVTSRDCLCPAEFVELDAAGAIKKETTGDLRRFVERVGVDEAKNWKFGMRDCPSEVIEFTSTYAEVASNLVRSDMPKLVALGDPDKVRITVWMEP